MKREVKAGLDPFGKRLAKRKEAREKEKRKADAPAAKPAKGKANAVPYPVPEKPEKRKKSGKENTNINKSKKNKGGKSKKGGKKNKKQKNNSKPKREKHESEREKVTPLNKVHVSPEPEPPKPSLEIQIEIGKAPREPGPDPNVNHDVDTTVPAGDYRYLEEEKVDGEVKHDLPEPIEVRISIRSEHQVVEGDYPEAPQQQNWNPPEQRWDEELAGDGVVNPVPEQDLPPREQPVRANPRLQRKPKAVKRGRCTHTIIFLVMLLLGVLVTGMILFLMDMMCNTPQSSTSIVGDPDLTRAVSGRSCSEVEPRSPRLLRITTITSDTSPTPLLNPPLLKTYLRKAPWTRERSSSEMVQPASSHEENEDSSDSLFDDFEENPEFEYSDSFEIQPE